MNLLEGDDAKLAEAYRRYQSGDLAGAGQLGSTLLDRRGDDPALTGLMGMIAAQTDDYEAAVVHLDHALRHTPDSLPLRISLAFALVNSGRMDQARAVAAAPDVPQLQRIIAYIDQCEGNAEAAISRYRRVLEQFPQDSESWDNLGTLLLDEGELGDALEAFRNSIALRPLPSVFVNLAKALAAGEHHSERQTLLREGTKQFPDDVPLLIELGLAEGAIGDHAAAEAAYRRALELRPLDSRAYLEYGMLLEKLNRLDALGDLIAEATSHDVTGPQLAFIRAWHLHRTGRFAEALPLAEQAAGAINASRHSQLLGEIHDRLGHVDQAFDAFTTMNLRSAEGIAAAHARGMNFPALVAAAIEKESPETVAKWVRPSEASGKDPIFIVGFPRSGTTLLDTWLMNVASVRVLEEAPAGWRIEAEIGGRPLESLSPEEVAALRERYFSLAAELDGAPLDDRTVVDKFPLNMVLLPLINRLFPDARIIFVERHPADVVLSCFMARFQINRATVQFHDLESAARLYDLSMKAFETAAELLPLRLHRVRYERMIDDPRAEMRDLFAFLDIPWSDAILDNQSSAARREHIATASYAQVGEPLYTRAVGRWDAYCHHLEPVLPILEPWVRRLGYVD